MASGATSGPDSAPGQGSSLLLLALDHHLDAGLVADELLTPM
jgi:hypothetical protein